MSDRDGTDLVSLVSSGLISPPPTPTPAARETESSLGAGSGLIPPPPGPGWQEHRRDECEVGEEGRVPQPRVGGEVGVLVP